MRFVKNDGGRLRAGWKGLRASDCVPRAIAIATHAPYRETRAALDALCKEMTGGLATTTNSGTPTPVSHSFLENRGWVLVLTKGKYLKDLPEIGKYVVCLSRHYVAVIDNVLHDTWDSRKPKYRTKCGSPKMEGYYVESWLWRKD